VKLLFVQSPPLYGLRLPSVSMPSKPWPDTLWEFTFGVKGNSGTISVMATAPDQRAAKVTARIGAYVYLLSGNR
jgi:hypothetical protein